MISACTSKASIGDNALTLEIGNSNEHTEQIKAAREAQTQRLRCFIPERHGTRSVKQRLNLPWTLGSTPSETCAAINSSLGSSTLAFPVPSYACGKDNRGFTGVVEEGGVYAVEPFNTTGESGLIENIGRSIIQYLPPWLARPLLGKRAKNQLKPLGAQMARNLEGVLDPPLRRALGISHAEETLPVADEASLQSKWNALVKKLISIRFLETYHVLRCKDGGNIAQFEHTVPSLLPVARRSSPLSKAGFSRQKRI